MYQRRFWGKRRRSFKRRKIELSERGIYEPVHVEEDFVKECIERLWYSGLPTFRERERIPRCPNCNESIGRPSDPGHPDLHGYIPAHKRPEQNTPLPFYIEAKRDAKSVLRAAQDEFLQRATRDGVLAFKAWNWEQVRAAFLSVGVVLP